MTSTRRERLVGAITGTTPWTWQNYAGSTAGPYPGAPIGDQRYMVDYVTKGFRKLQADGQLVMNPYESLHTVFTAGQTSTQKIHSSGGTWEWGEELGVTAHRDTQWGTGGPPRVRYDLVSEADVNRLKTLASTRVLSQIGRPRTDNWENVAEAAKTIEALKAPFYSWFRYYRTLGDVGSSILSASNLWLQMRYGLLPVMKSVIETVEQLQKKPRPERQTTRAQEVISVNSVNLVAWDDSIYLRRAYGIQKTETHQVRAMSIDEALFGIGTAYDLGFTVKGLWALPWELVPWSFVADWFLNVGDYIGSLGNYFQERSLGQCLVHTTTQSEFRYVAGLSTLIGGWGVLRQPEGWVRRDVVWKTRHLGLSSAGITVKADFRLDTMTRVGDMMALIGQSIIKKFI